MNTHLSQPAGEGAFDGQHGISCDMSAADMSRPALSAADDADAWSTIVAIEASGDATAITGRENGAIVSPTIIAIASNRFMVP